MRGLDLIRALRSSQVALDSYYPLLNKLRRTSGRYVFLAAMPKSGSTFLAFSLCNVLGYTHSYLASSWWNIEQELYLPKVLDTFGEGTVVQQHVKANEPNLQILRRFDIRPTVITRNIHDVVVSVRDHLLREHLGNIPTLIVPPDYAELDHERQLDIVITLFCPWLIAFHVSWYRAVEGNDADVLWLTYEESVQDWQGSIRRVVDFYSLNDVIGDIDLGVQAAVVDPRTRFNKGVIGRGDEELTRRQKDEIKRMSSFFPRVDFSRAGL